MIRRSSLLVEFFVRLLHNLAWTRFCRTVLREKTVGSYIKSWWQRDEFASRGQVERRDKSPPSLSGGLDELAAF